jgi:hypothetical protein
VELEDPEASRAIARRVWVAILEKAGITGDQLRAAALELTALESASTNKRRTDHVRCQ